MTFKAHIFSHEGLYDLAIDRLKDVGMAWQRQTKLDIGEAQLLALSEEEAKAKH